VAPWRVRAAHWRQCPARTSVWAWRAASITTTGSRITGIWCRCARPGMAAALYVAHGVHMPLPDGVGARLAAGGVELSEVMDALFGRVGSNHDEGAYGLLSAGRITRDGVFRDAVIAALTPFQNVLYRAQAGD